MREPSHPLIPPAVQAFPTAEAWVEACAARLTEALTSALATRPRAVFAGAGGSTPAPIYRRLASADLDWSRVTVTLVDERHVSESSQDSNAALLKQTLLIDRAAAARFLPLHSPAVTVDRAAALAAAALRAEGGRLDAVLLGMGEDGHVCSMFPQSPTLKTLLSPTLKPTVLGVPRGRDGLAPSLERLSINLPYLMSAHRVVLAISGPAKREIFEIEAEADPATRPIAALIAANVPLDVLWTEKV